MTRPLATAARRSALTLALAAGLCAAPAAPAATFTLIDTVGRTFDLNFIGGPETALASQVWEVQGGLLGTSTTYEVRYLVTSALVDFFDVHYEWGPLSAGVTMTGVIKGLDLSPNTQNVWVRAAGSLPPFPVSSARATLDPDCFGDCAGYGLQTVVASVQYHAVQNAVAIPPSPGAPRFASFAALAQPLEGDPLRLDNRFDAVVNGTGTTPVRFVSEVAARSDGTYRYAYEVFNQTDEVMSFDWVAAGLAGTIDPQQSVSRSFVSALSPVETTAAARFGRVYDDFGVEEIVDFSGPTGIYAPVPEPGAALTLLAGLALLGWRRYRSRV